MSPAPVSGPVTRDAGPPSPGPWSQAGVGDHCSASRLGGGTRQGSGVAGELPSAARGRRPGPRRPRHRDPHPAQSWPHRPAGELGAAPPRGAGLSLCLARALAAGRRLPLRGDPGGRARPRWPRAWWPPAQRSCPDLRLREECPPRTGPAGAGCRGRWAPGMCPCSRVPGRCPGHPEPGRGSGLAPVCPSPGVEVGATGCIPGGQAWRCPLSPSAPPLPLQRTLHLLTHLAFGGALG